MDGRSLHQVIGDRAEGLPHLRALVVRVQLSRELQVSTVMKVAGSPAIYAVWKWNFEVRPNLRRSASGVNQT